MFWVAVGATSVAVILLQPWDSTYMYRWVFHHHAKYKCLVPECERHANQFVEINADKVHTTAPTLLMFGENEQAWGQTVCVPAYHCLCPRGQGGPGSVSSSCVSGRRRACCCTPSASAAAAGASNASLVCWAPTNKQTHLNLYTQKTVDTSQDNSDVHVKVAGGSVTWMSAEPCFGLSSGLFTIATISCKAFRLEHAVRPSETKPGAPVSVSPVTVIWQQRISITWADVPKAQMWMSVSLQCLEK